MATIDPSFRQRLLVQSLTALAADPSVQVAWLKGHGVPTEEIALDFDNAFGVAKQLIEEGRLSPEALPDLRDIDKVFSEMSGERNASRWAEDALYGDEGWVKARKLARRILMAERGEWRAPLPDICIIR
ncbi:hypothetical protein [Streptomyces fructofermentans]|uniref:hypothetical protein n=1 Tax=Streptomyces fructofermentans TaxID=152141 RepID=UPI0037BDBA93